MALINVQLGREDHRWWWQSFFYGGSTGLFVYAHSFFYFFNTSDMNGLLQVCGVNRVFAIYHILLGWETCKDYYETDELPNPRPTQPKRN